MPVVIDGNNLLHSLAREARSREEVRKMVLEAARDQRVTLIIVFDGPPPPGSPRNEHLGRVTVRYAGAVAADDVIVTAIPDGRRASEWVVVTDDYGLRARVAARGAKVQSLGEWNRRRRATPGAAPTEPKLNAREVAEWEAYFSGDVEDARSDGSRRRRR